MADDDKIKKGAINKGKAAVEKKANVLARMKIVYVAIDSVKPNSYNPNRQDEREFELLKLSMREDGFTAPIVVQEGTNEIVDGEHRWRAARDIGITEIPVVFTNMTLAQMRISTLRHNRAVGSEDVDLATDLLRDLRELGALDWAQEALGIDDDQLQKLIDDVKAPDELAGEEWSEAWVPTKNASGMESQDVEKEAVAFTPAAAVKQKEFQERLGKAKNEEERVKIEFEQRAETFRLIVVFEAADAAMVRSVLEPMPAAKILEMCKARVASAQAEAPAAE